ASGDLFLVGHLDSATVRECRVEDWLCDRYGSSGHVAEFEYELVEFFSRLEDYVGGYGLVFSVPDIDGYPVPVARNILYPWISNLFQLLPLVIGELYLSDLIFRLPLFFDYSGLGVGRVEIILVENGCIGGLTHQVYRHLFVFHQHADNVVDLVALLAFLSLRHDLDHSTERLGHYSPVGDGEGQEQRTQLGSAHLVEAELALQVFGFQFEINHYV